MYLFFDTRGGIFVENYYEVNEETSLILYKDNGSEIVEGDRVFNLNLIPNNIISYSCEYFGSSLLIKLYACS